MGAIWLALSMTAGVQSEIEPHEVIVLYPTFAHRVADGDWEMSVHGVVFEPEDNSKKRAAALAAFRGLLGLSRDQAATAIFSRRARAFLVDNQSGKAVQVRFGAQTFDVGKSGSNGHFGGTVRLSEPTVRELQPAGGSGWLEFEAITRPQDDRRFVGHAQLIEDEGLSVISDIDDTIKHSQVGNRRALIKNTFLQPFAPVPGMSDLYGQWSKLGAAFHYLSASPWQLYTPLDEFRQTEGFPAGSFHLKLFRFKDASFFELFASHEEYKAQAIELLVRAFPKRRFILVGDSGEKDPEIYGAIARKFPKQVAWIFIRDVNQLGPEAERFKLAFDALPGERWKIFSEPKELQGLVRLPEEVGSGN